MIYRARCKPRNISSCRHPHPHPPSSPLPPRGYLIFLNLLQGLFFLQRPRLGEPRHLTIQEHVTPSHGEPIPSPQFPCSISLDQCATVLPSGRPVTTSTRQSRDHCRVNHPPGIHHHLRWRWTPLYLAHRASRRGKLQRLSPEEVKGCPEHLKHRRLWLNRRQPPRRHGEPRPTWLRLVSIAKRPILLATVSQKFLSSLSFRSPDLSAFLEHACGVLDDDH